MKHDVEHELSIEKKVSFFLEQVMPAVIVAQRQLDILKADARLEIAPNAFGDMTLKADLILEQAIIDVCKSIGNIRVIAEEHGDFDIGDKPNMLISIDGLDGSDVYKGKNLGKHWGPMFTVYNSLDPRYRDYLLTCACDMGAGTWYMAQRGSGVSIIDMNSGNKTPLVQVHRPVQRILVDEYFDVNNSLAQNVKEAYPDFVVTTAYSAIGQYVELLAGRAIGVIECTRKKNFEPAAAYGLLHELGYGMLDQYGEDYGSRRYLDFRSDAHELIISAVNRDVAKKILNCQSV